MIQYNKEAVADAAEGGSRKRGETATGASLYNTYSARPELAPSAYKGYRQLIVKNNNGSRDDLDLLRVARFLCELMKFQQTEHYYFENGKQNRRHIHMLVRAPKLYDLKETTHLFRKQNKLQFEIVREVMLSNSFSKPSIETHYIDLSSYSFEVELFTSNEHIFYCIEEYWMKEQNYIHRGCEDICFIDDEQQKYYDFKQSFINALNSI